MAENSRIEWTDHTFNGWIGCTKVGPGCDHCYAEALATSRLGVPWGPGAPRRRTAASTWNQPRRWNARAAKEGRRYRVFCSSLADVFDNEVPDAWRVELFALIRETPHLDWLLVTKRIGNAAKMAEAAGGLPDNVWLGATIVNQAEADRDIPKLLTTPASKRFLSMEPLLGPVDLTCLTIGGDAEMDALTPHYWETEVAAWRDSSDEWEDDFGDFFGRLPEACSGQMHPVLDWVIVGGESGAQARPMHPDWARALRDQCADAGVPFLFKQWGEWAPGVCASNTIGWHSVRTADWFDEQWIFEIYSGDFEMHADDEPTLFRAGKKAAGRLLDGVTHDGVPA